MKKHQKTLLLAAFLLLWGCSGGPSSDKEGQEASRQEETIAAPQDEKKLPVYYTPFDSRYSGDGFYTLINGEYGNLSFSDGHWQGFREKGLDVVIDLGEVQPIQSVTGNFLKSHIGWIFLPGSFKVYVSDNMKDYTFAGEVITEVPPEAEEAAIEQITLDSLDVEARYVRLKIQSIGPTPDYIEDANGRPSWFFIDEVIIR